MATATIEDKSGSIEVLIFPQVLNTNGRLVSDGNIVRIMGTVSINEDENPKILCNEIILAEKVAEAIKNNSYTVGRESSRRENTKMQNSLKVRIFIPTANIFYI